jgi:general secretion pathway protein K
MRASLPSIVLRTQNQDGFILVAVLWMLAGLSALTSVYAAYVVQTAAGVSTHDMRLRAQAIASAAVELSVYKILAQPAQSRSTSGDFAFRLGEANALVRFRSEAARIDLNAAPKPLVMGLFAALGARPDAAEAYADRIIGWRSPIPPDGGGEAAVYRGLGYGPRGGKFPHVYELALIRGLPETLVERALPYVTVFSGRPQVSVFEAAAEVIAALPGIKAEHVNAIVAHRGASVDAKKRLLTELGPAQQFATLEGGKAIRHSIGIELGSGYRFKSEVVVLIGDQGPEPYSVLSWRDDPDEIAR